MNNLLNNSLTGILLICTLLFSSYVIWKTLELSITAFQEGSNYPKYIATAFLFLELLLMWISPSLTIILLLLIIISMTTLTKIYRHKTAKLKKRNFQKNIDHQS